MHTVKETAAQLKVSAATMYALIAAGRIQCHRVGVGRGTIRISSAAITEYLNSTISESTEERKPRVPRQRLKHIKL